MLRKSVLWIGFVPALVLLGSLAARSQDSPSLGDVARQLRSQKSGTQTKPATTITNDDLPSGSASGVLGLGEPVKPTSPGQPATGSAAGSSQADFAQLESGMNKLDALDGPTMVKLALQGSDADFPGRSAWEERLVAAKQAYVSQGRELIEKGKQIVATAQALRSAHANADDPRVKELASKLKALTQEAVQLDSHFQAVVLEGRDLAQQAAAH